MTLAIVNRAAGGGRCARQADETLSRLRSAGVEFDIAETRGPGHARELARDAYRAGVRRFLAVGGDGTAHEIVNGLVPEGNDSVLGFLPLGTGNSFLRDYGAGEADHAFRAILEGRSRPADVIRLRHERGEMYSINLVCVGFAADVATITNRRFKGFGAAGYALGVLSSLARMRRRAFPLRADGGPLDEDRCLFLAFSNSKYTGGRMKIAPDADASDGLIEYVRFGPVGRLGLLRRFPRIYAGTHIGPPWGSRRAVKRVDFELDEEIDLMIDGEVLRLRPLSLEIVPAALEVLV